MRRKVYVGLLLAPLLAGVVAAVPNTLVSEAYAQWHGGGRGFGGPGGGRYYGGGGPGWGWHGRHYHDHRSGAVVGGILGGLALGVVGGALLSQPYAPPPPPPVVYAPPPVFYAPPPVVYAAPPPPMVMYPSY